MLVAALTVALAAAGCGGATAVSTPSAAVAGPLGGSMSCSGTSSAGTAGMIGFYDDRAQARRLEPDVAKYTRVFHGQVERDGAENVIWLAVPRQSVRATVMACAAG
jgi:hypothetical protein